MMVGENFNFKHRESEVILKKIEEYLSKGNKIEIVPVGKMTECPLGDRSSTLRTYYPKH